MTENGDYFNVQVMDKQVNELKLLISKTKQEIIACSSQQDYKRIIKNHTEIILPMMYRRHTIELATVIGVGEKKINIKLLYKANAKGLIDLMKNELVKLRLVDNRRHILNMLVNFFKSHQLIEDELIYLKTISEEAPRLPFWDGEITLNEFVIGKFWKASSCPRMHLKTAVSRIAFKHFSQIKDFFGKIVDLVSVLDEDPLFDLDFHISKLLERLAQIRLKQLKDIEEIMDIFVVHRGLTHGQNARIKCDCLQNKIRNDLSYSFFFNEDASCEQDRAMKFFNEDLKE